MDSAVAGESEVGDGGNEMGESGSETRPLEQARCGEEEKGTEPPKVVGHGGEGGSVSELLSISVPEGNLQGHSVVPLLKKMTESDKVTASRNDLCKSELKGSNFEKRA